MSTESDVIEWREWEIGKFQLLRRKFCREPHDSAVAFPSSLRMTRADIVEVFLSLDFNFMSSHWQSGDWLNWIGEGTGDAVHYVFISYQLSILKQTDRLYLLVSVTRIVAVNLITPLIWGELNEARSNVKPKTRRIVRIFWDKFIAELDDFKAFHPSQLRLSFNWQAA